MRTSRLAAGAAMVAVGLLAGYGGGGSDSAPKVPENLQESLANGLVVSLTASSITVPVGGTITYTLKVSNYTNSAISYQINADNFVEPNTDGEFKVVSDATGTGFPEVFTPVSPSFSRTLDAGKSFTDTARLGPSDGVFQSRGTYSATVTYDVQGNSVTLSPIAVTAQ